MTWQLQEAKNNLSELVNLALTAGPQMITRHGKPAVVVISAEQYEREAAKEKLSTLLQECPARGWKVKRSRGTGRTIQFE